MVRPCDFCSSPDSSAAIFGDSGANAAQWRIINCTFDRSLGVGNLTGRAVIAYVHTFVMDNCVIRNLYSNDSNVIYVCASLVLLC